MNSRERILAALTGSDADRIPITEIGIWPETLRRWRLEGLPEGVSPHDYFELDKIEFFSFDGTLGFEEAIVSENGEYRLYTDSDGCTYKKFVDRPVPPQLIRSGITDEAIWNRVRNNLKPAIARYDDFVKDIVFGGLMEESQNDRYDKCKQRNIFSVLVPTEPCWYFLRLLGEEEALATIGLDPEYAGRIIEQYNEFSIGMLKLIFSRGYKFDALWVFSDLCYKNGMLFSPSFYREKVLSQQRRLFDLAKENGLKVIYHSDGNISSFLPLVMETGIDCIQPLEVRAGNDVRMCFAQFPGILSCMGNINMDIFTTSKENAETEVEKKIISVKDTHRYLFHSDHSVPDNVSFEIYSHAIKTAYANAWY